MPKPFYRFLSLNPISPKQWIFGSLLALSLFFNSSVFGEDLTAKNLEKAKGIIIFLPERGVSAKWQLFQEEKPARGIIKPYLMNDGSLFEIDNSLILEVVEMNKLFPENVLKGQETLLAQAKALLGALKEKYPAFLTEWDVIAKAQEKEASLALKGYVKQKNRWMSAVEWNLLEKAMAEPQEKAPTQLVTKAGKTFNNTKFSRIDGSTLIITHESGIAKIPKSDLPAQVIPHDKKIEDAIAKILSTQETPSPTPEPAPIPEKTAAGPTT